MALIDLSVKYTKIVAFLALVVTYETALGQTCTSNPTTLGSNTNFTSVSWTATGGVTAAQCTAIANGTNSSTTANFVVDLSNGVILTISNNVTIHGNFDITGGPGSELSVNGGGSSTTLHVTGDLGDATNNGVIYNVQASSDHIQVDGTLYGKNNDAFTGSGTIKGGTLDVKNGTTCGTPCPASGGFTNCTSGDSFCSNNNIVLPITLISFRAEVEQDKVALKWSTASEINFDYFSLQRSTEGKLFDEIVQVKGHGTSSELHNYHYEDINPIIGRSYYRLTSNDFDGYQETFKVISVEYMGEKKMTISPNPSDGFSVKLNFNFAADEDAKVTIYDNLGVVIGVYQVSGVGSINFDGALKSGIYLAKYSSSTFSQAERFLVK